MCSIDQQLINVDRLQVDEELYNEWRQHIDEGFWGRLNNFVGSAVYKAPDSVCVCRYILG
jgi:hypothetical protein